MASLCFMDLKIQMHAVTVEQETQGFNRLKKVRAIFGIKNDVGIMKDYD